MQREIQKSNCQIVWVEINVTSGCTLLQKVKVAFLQLLHLWNGHKSFDHSVKLVAEVRDFELSCQDGKTDVANLLVHCNWVL